MSWKDKLKKKVIEKGKEVMEEKGKEIIEKVKDQLAKEELPDPNPGTADVKSDVEAAEDPKPAPEKKQLTPEEQRQADAMVLQISMFGDSQLEVKSIRNINSRAMAEYLVSRAKDDYFKADVANLAAVRLIDLIQQGNKNKKKSGSIWTPGGNK